MISHFVKGGGGGGVEIQLEATHWNLILKLNVFVNTWLEKLFLQLS